MAERAGQPVFNLAFYVVRGGSAVPRANLVQNESPYFFITVARTTNRQIRR